jgi:hypothetical protein
MTTSLFRRKGFPPSISVEIVSKMTLILASSPFRAPELNIEYATAQEQPHITPMWCYPSHAHVGQIAPTYPRIQSSHISSHAPVQLKAIKTTIATNNAWYDSRTCRSLPGEAMFASGYSYSQFRMLGLPVVVQGCQS